MYRRQLLRMAAAACGLGIGLRIRRRNVAKRLPETGAA